MWTVLLGIVSVAACSRITLYSVNELEQYFIDEYSDSQVGFKIPGNENYSNVIGLHKVFDYRGCQSYRLLETGNLTSIKLADDRFTVTSKQKVKNKIYLFPVVDKGFTTYILWSNGSHHSPGVDINYKGLSKQYDFGQVNYKINEYYEKHGEGYFDLDVSWTNPFPAVYRGFFDGPYCRPSKGSDADCTYKSPTSMRLVMLAARTAVLNQTVLKVNVGFDHTCVFPLPPIKLKEDDCPVNSSHCRPPCAITSNVVSATAEIVDDTTLNISWLPPSGGEHVAAYVIRWGLLDELIESSSSFPINNTVDFLWITPARNRTKQYCSFEINGTNIHGKYIAAQVVALCKDQAVALPGYTNSDKGIHNVTVHGNLFNELFVPARYDVPYSPDRQSEQEENHGGSPEVSLKVISPSTDPYKAESDINSAGVILSSTIGSVIAVLAILTVVFMVLKRRRNCHKDNMEEARRTVFDNLQTNPLYQAIYVNVDEADKWELSPSAIEWGEEIGFGAFGSVFKCFLQDDKDGQSQTVALKTLTGSNTDLSRQQFIQEIMVMKELEQHPNILQLIGCLTISDPVCLVMEYASNGDLLTYLQHQRTESVDLEVFADEDAQREAPLYIKLLKMAVDITAGMEYISSKGYVHRDLAARNLLLDETFTVKIADFGLARHLHTSDVYVVQHSKRLPVKWLSMEALSELKFSTASDVWAFGVVLFELMSLGETPYPAIDPTDILQYLASGHRMAKPDICDDTLYTIMMRCWQAKPKDRPSFTELHEQLSTHCYSVTTDSTSTHSSISADEGFDAPYIPPTPPSGRVCLTRSPLSSESSAFSEISMFISSPMLKRPDPTSKSRLHNVLTDRPPIILESTHL